MKLNKILEENNYIINEFQDIRFNKFYKLLEEWNYKIDITKIINEEEVFIKHFLDSLLITKSGVIEKNQKIIDVGTGGGFPGIPLKIYSPSSEIVLLDSLKKRINFLEVVIDELELDKITAVHGRAEEVARKEEYREKFDIATSRAVANMSTLLEYNLPFIKVGGYFIAMKGPNYKDELKESMGAIKTLGGVLDKTIEYKLPYNYGDRSLIIVKKIKNTPHRYPRAGGKPKNKPLN